MSAVYQNGLDPPKSPLNKGDFDPEIPPFQGEI